MLKDQSIDDVISFSHLFLLLYAMCCVPKDNDLLFIKSNKNLSYLFKVEVKTC